MENKVTDKLIQASALQLRRTSVSPARAGELARDVERLNNKALAAAAESDFNDEPARFTATLLRLKSPDVRR